MLRPRSLSLFLIALLGLLAGCDSGGDDTPPSLTDTWEGQFVSSDDLVVLRLEIVEGATLVSGSGQITLAGEQVVFMVQGSYLHPVLTLEINFSDRPPGTFNGNVTENRKEISGNISGPGFSGTVSLRREE